MEITDGRKLSPSARAAILREAVYAVISEKKTQAKAADIFGVARTSVCLFVTRLKQNSVCKLLERRPGDQEYIQEMYWRQSALIN